MGVKNIIDKLRSCDESEKLQLAKKLLELVKNKDPSCGVLLDSENYSVIIQNLSAQTDDGVRNIMCQVLLELGVMDENKTKTILEQNNGRELLDSCMKSNNRDLVNTSTLTFNKYINLSPSEKYDNLTNSKEKMEMIEKEILNKNYNESKVFYQKLLVLVENDKNVFVSSKIIDKIINEINTNESARDDLVPLLYKISEDGNRAEEVIKGNGHKVLVKQFNSDNSDNHLYKSVPQISKKSGEILALYAKDSIIFLFRK